MTSATDPAEWDALYRERDTIWSGEPNAQLTAETAHLSPGAALDVGCGEGADAVWLARRGWDVTAADVSEVALDRARTHAKAAGLPITFVATDLVTSPPRPQSFDLVSAQFFQLPDPPRTEAYRGLGEAVAPGGHLLVVGHDPHGHAGGTHHPERFFTIEDLLALFDPDRWTVVTAELRDRRAVHHGELTDLRDVVVRLQRAG